MFLYIHFFKIIIIIVVDVFLFSKNYLALPSFIYILFLIERHEKHEITWMSKALFIIVNNIFGELFVTLFTSKL